MPQIMYYPSVVENYANVHKIIVKSVEETLTKNVHCKFHHHGIGNCAFFFPTIFLWYGWFCHGKNNSILDCRSTGIFRSYHGNKMKIQRSQGYDLFLLQQESSFSSEWMT